MMIFWGTFYRMGFKCRSCNQQHKQSENPAASPRLLDKQKYTWVTRGMQANPVPSIFQWAVSFQPGRGKCSGNCSIFPISHRLLKCTRGCSGFGPNLDRSAFRVIKCSSWQDVCCLHDSWDKKQWVLTASTWKSEKQKAIIYLSYFIPPSAGPDMSAPSAWPSHAHNVTCHRGWHFPCDLRGKSIVHLIKHISFFYFFIFI